MKKFPTILLGIIIITAITVVTTVFFVNQTKNKSNTSQINKSFVSASLPEPLTLEERIEKADTIIRAIVIEKLPSQHVKKERSEYVYTDYLVQVDEYLKNPLTYKNLKVRILGGDTSNEQMVTDYEPTFSIGEEAVIFLTRLTYLTDDAPNDVYSVFLGKDGKFAIENSKAIGGYISETYELDELLIKIKK